VHVRACTRWEGVHQQRRAMQRSAGQLTWAVAGWAAAGRGRAGRAAAAPGAGCSKRGVVQVGEAAERRPAALALQAAGA
jgi:hypothetical protein